MVWQFFPHRAATKGRKTFSNDHNSYLLEQKSRTISCPQDYLSTDNTDQSRVVESFVRDLEAVLGTKRTEISIAEDWMKFRPAGVKESDVAEYLKDVRRKSLNDVSD